MRSQRSLSAKSLRQGCKTRRYTHSQHVFFREILLNSGRLQDNREAPVNWSLLRIVKSDYSACEKLSMHEMLNEYQALWQTLKDVRDEKTQPVVLFNTMRNILEYYFSFACKTEKLKDALESLAGEYSDAGEYDSFYRAINRHSHSDGRNIFSTGVIDKDRYLKMFRRVFIQTDDDEHYLAMMGSLKDCQRRAFKQEASSPAGTVHLTRRSERM